MFNLIQKNSSKVVTTNMCMCELLAATMVNILIKFKSTKTLLNIETGRLEFQPMEGPMLKALVAPFTRVDIVCCSKQRTTVVAGRCLQCSPLNVHREVDDPRKKKKTSAVTRKKQAVTETLPENLVARTPEQVSLYGRRFRRPALPTLRVRGGLGRETREQLNNELVRHGYVSCACEQEESAALCSLTGIGRDRCSD